MEGSSPRQWPYASSNSPLPLPEHPVLFTNQRVIPLDCFAGEMTDESVEGDALHAYVLSLIHI